MSDAAGPAIGSVRVGLHFAEALAAAELAASGCARSEVVEQVALTFPGLDEERRRRIASTIARRVLCKPGAHSEAELGEGPPCPLAQLIAAAGHSRDARHLLLHATARHERLVLRIAGEVFYPRFVLGRPPDGPGGRKLATPGGGRLLDSDEVVTHQFVAEFARRRWGFDDPSSTQTALRILREGGALDATWRDRGEGRCLGYFPSHRGPGWQVFVYALWEEFIARGRTSVPRAHLRSMALAHLFCLPGPVVDALSERAADEGFCAIEGRRSGGPVSATHGSFEAAAESLAGSIRAET